MLQEMPSIGHIYVKMNHIPWIKWIKLNIFSNFIFYLLRIKYISAYTRIKFNISNKLNRKQFDSSSQSKKMIACRVQKWWIYWFKCPWIDFATISVVIEHKQLVCEGIENAVSRMKALDHTGIMYEHKNQVHLRKR